ncbi:hypothetical protein [Rhodococcus sp. BE178]|uniref:hypothetical protein n=1 Tax=Rhodococcus sp. BE178 TaxID=2817737 RepID=UPI003D214329
MPEDPIERINVDLEVYGIPQTPGLPPMTETYLHVRRRQDGAAERAVIGLPAYHGEQGERGAAGMVHQGTRTLAELEGLAMTLGENELNFTYRCTGTDNLWVWIGTTFRVYENAFGTKGDRGPAPVMTGGTVTVDGVVQEGAPGVRIQGADGGPYSVGIDLPPLPVGPPGPVGPAGPIYTSIDVSQTTPPTDAQILVHDAALGKMTWRNAMLPVEEYVVGSNSFETVTKGASDTRHVLTSVTIPPRPYRYRPDIVGGVEIKRVTGQQIDVEVLLGDPVSGSFIGHGRGDSPDLVGGSSYVNVVSWADRSMNPGETWGTVAPNTEATIHMIAVKRAGNIGGWQVRRDFAQLRIRLMRVV